MTSHEDATDGHHYSERPEVAQSITGGVLPARFGEGLLEQCAALDAFRREGPNLYERVRALFFIRDSPVLFALEAGMGAAGLLPFRGYEQLLQRRFEEAIDTFLKTQADRPNHAVSSALATAYHRLAFQTLADQVRRSVRSVRGNQWMFRMGHYSDQPLRIRPELLKREGTRPVIRELTPVRWT